MNEPTKERGSATPPDPDDLLEGVQRKEERSADADAVPPSPEGKTNAGPEEQIVGRALDTIPLDDGSYLEPPD